MTKLSLIGGLVILMSLAMPTQDSQACGDKFLVSGRGVRYQHNGVPLHPASILIYRNPESKFTATSKDSQLQSDLKRAGHTISVADGPMEMQEALKSGRYDILLADLSDAPAVENQLKDVAVRPILLPVIYDPAASGADTAKKQYGRVVKSPEKTANLLSTIDSVMRTKVKA